MNNLYSFDFNSKDRVREIGQQINQLYKSNPVLAIQDQIFGWWFDKGMLFVVKCYYWPAFIAGSQDDIQSLFNPKTYSICKL